MYFAFNECGYFKTLWLANDKSGLKCILHNESGYFKTLWLANDKWGLKCILHNESGYFKTLWHTSLQMINEV